MLTYVDATETNIIAVLRQENNTKHRIYWIAQRCRVNCESVYLISQFLKLFSIFLFDVPDNSIPPSRPKWLKNTLYRCSDIRYKHIAYNFSQSFTHTKIDPFFRIIKTSTTYSLKERVHFCLKRSHIFVDLFSSRASPQVESDFFCRPPFLNICYLLFG